MHDRSVRSAHLRAENSNNTLWKVGRTRRGIKRGYALDVEVSGNVNQPVLLHVDQESKVSQGIGMGLSNDENPRPRSSEVEVERFTYLWQCAKERDCRVVVGGQW